MRNDPVMDIGLNYCIHQDDRSGERKEKTSGIKCKILCTHRGFHGEEGIQKIP